MRSNIPSAHQDPASSSRASWRCPGRRSRSPALNEKKQPCHASTLKKRERGLAMPPFHFWKNWVAGFNPEKYARHWGSSSQCEPAQSKCTSTCHKSHFLRKSTGKMKRVEILKHWSIGLKPPQFEGTSIQDAPRIRFCTFLDHEWPCWIIPEAKR